MWALDPYSELDPKDLIDSTKHVFLFAFIPSSIGLVNPSFEHAIRFLSNLSHQMAMFIDRKLPAHVGLRMPCGDPG